MPYLQDHIPVQVKSCSHPAPSSVFQTAPEGAFFSLNTALPHLPPPLKLHSATI